MNKYLIDAYNLIHAIPELKKYLDESLEAGREELLRYINNYLAGHNVEIVVVFDGSEPPIAVDPPHPTKELTIRYSQAPFKADPMLKNLIRSEGHKKSVTLVTDDMDIVRFARMNHAKLLSTKAFFEMIAKSFRQQDIFKKYDRDMSDDELDEWMKLFGEK